MEALSSSFCFCGGGIVVIGSTSGFLFFWQGKDNFNSAAHLRDDFGSFGKVLYPIVARL